jgi:integrase
LADLNVDTMQAFDKWLQIQVAKATRKATITKLRTLWRAAHSDGQTSSGPPVVSQAQCGVARYYPGGGTARPFTVFTEAELSAIHEPEKPPTTLRDFIPRYAAERGIRPRTITCLQQRLGMFEKLLGRPAMLTDLNDTTINLWTTRLFEAGLGPVTVRGYSGAVLALWRAAYELHFIETRPGRIRKIRHKAAAPRCWTASQLLQVVDAFRNLQGQMQCDPSIRRSTFWSAFVMVGYYSALRFGDLVSLRWDQVQEGRIVLTMSKTGDQITCPLPPDASEAVKKLRGGGRELVFGQLMNIKNTQLFFRRVMKAQGLPGSIKWLRRTSATLLERELPGTAKAHLGHRTHGLAYKHYVDPRLLQEKKPIPPTIEALIKAS